MKRRRTTFPKENKSKKIINIAESKLTIKQELFCQHYIITNGNGFRSAKAAGYAGNDNVLMELAYKNLKIPKIVKRINSLFNIEHGDLNCKVEERIKILSEFARNNSTAQVENPITGKEIQIWEISPKERMKAINLLNKMENIYDDSEASKTVNINQEIHMHLNNLNDSNLEELISAISRQSSERSYSKKQISVNS